MPVDPAQLVIEFSTFALDTLETDPTGVELTRYVMRRCGEEDMNALELTGMISVMSALAVALLIRLGTAEDSDPFMLLQDLAKAVYKDD